MPIPVHLITGPLGVGKTTAIARLLANKPAHEPWLVILNEFTDTGIDTLTLAAAARGAYDLRTIAGGCLCCTGEADFRQQLSALLAQPASLWPARIVIEPSGIGHPSAVIEELRLFERSQALQLVSVVTLLDEARWLALCANETVDDTLSAQVAAADVLLLAKADQVSDAQRQAFQQWASTLFPPKRGVGEVQAGELPAQALQPPAATFGFQLAVAPASHGSRVAAHAHDHTGQPHTMAAHTRVLCWANQPVTASAYTLLDRQACGWVWPSQLLCDPARLDALMADTPRWHSVERFKAVLRVGIDDWRLVQYWQGQYAQSSCAWRQDQRMELQLKPQQRVSWAEWDAAWQQCMLRCPVT